MLSTLPPELLDDASALWDEVRSTKPESDPRDFVAELHRRGKIDDKALRKALLELEASRAISFVREKPPQGMDAATQILGPLGAGAMGEVLIAKEPGLNRIVAVKRLLPAASTRPSIVRRFYTEAQVTAQLDHPSIVPIHALIDSGDGALAYSMKLVRGRTFEDYLAETRDQWRKQGHESETHTLQARLERFLLICDALAYAHDKGIVHRDMKPENVMVGSHGEVIVMDWGIAKVLGRREEPVETQDAPPAHSTQTRIGVIMGTPRYMSPEQADGQNDILNGHSDQYALGLILQEVVTLLPALSDKLNLEGTLAWASSAKRVPLVHAAGQRVPKDLEAIIAKACARNPKDRYAHVRLLAEDVRRHLRDQPTLARPDGLFGKLTRFVGRHRVAMLNAFMLLALLSVATVAGLFVFATGTVAAVQSRASTREAQVEANVSRVQDHARNVDAALMRFETLLTGLARAAEITLNATRSVGLVPHDPYTLPDLRPASSYAGRPLDTSWADVHAVQRTRDIDLFAHRLASMSPIFARTLLDADASLRADPAGLRDASSPLRWAHVWTRRGMRASYPGIPEASDGPTQPSWSDVAAQATRPAWLEPRQDPRGMGTILTAVLAIRDGSEPVGVAAVDVDGAWFSANVLGHEKAKGTAWLIGPSDTVLLTNKGDTGVAFPYPDTLPRMRRNPSGGHANVGGNEIYWARLHTVDWIFAVQIGSDAP